MDFRHGSVEKWKNVLSAVQGNFTWLGKKCSHWGAKESEPIPLGERLKAISKGNAAPPNRGEGLNSVSHVEP